MRRFAAVITALVVLIAGSGALLWLAGPSLLNLFTPPSLRVVELEGLALRESQLHIEKLRLEYDGAPQILSDLRLSAGLDRRRLQQVEIGSARLQLPETQDSGDQKLPINQALETLHALPVDELTIHELFLESRPEPAQLHYAAHGDLQSLRLTQGSWRASLQTRRAADAFTAQLQLQHQENEVASAELALQRLQNGYTPRLQALLRPGAAAMLSDIELAQPVKLLLTASAATTVQELLQASWLLQLRSEVAIGLENVAGLPLAVELNLPSGASLHVQRDRIMLGDAPPLKLTAQGSESRLWRELDASATVTLRSGQCTLQDRLQCESELSVNDFTAALHHESLKIEEFGGGFSTAIGLEGDRAQLSVRELAVTAAKIEAEAVTLSAPALDMQQPADLEADLATGQWQLAAPKLLLTLANARVEPLQLATRIQLKDLLATGGPAFTLETRLLSESIHLRLPDYWLPAVATDTRLKMSGPDANFRGTLSAPGGLELLAWNLNYDLPSAVGRADFSSEVQATVERPLSTFFPSWPFDADIYAGKLASRWQVQGKQTPQGLELRGTGEHALSGISGFYGETVLVGLDAEADLVLAPGTRVFTSAPVAGRVQTIDAGFDIDNVSFAAGFDTAIPKLDIHALHADLLGGSVRARPGLLALDPVRGGLTLHVQSIDLQRLVALANYPAIEVSGELSGTLPLKFTPGGTVINAGELSALAPGGVLRYTGDAKAGSSLDMVSDALSNYQYEVLKAGLELDAAGDVRASLRLEGANPDFREGQPIHLNLELEDNIPQLLQSLQAGRDVTRALERRLRR